MQARARRPWVAGNWKMNGSLAAARTRCAELLAGLAGLACEVVVAPPFVHLEAVARVIDGSALRLAAQDACQHGDGAYTGAVSAAMLAELGCRYVLVGHSERRALFGDDDALVAAKFAAVRAAGMVPVLCVGETLAEREAGRTRAVVLRQLDAVLDAAGAGEMVLAYEPVWAIGTGRSASAAQAQEVHALLRARLREQDEAAAATRIVYGGSVKAANAAGLLVQPDIDGALVGGASLDAREFLEICAQAR